MSVIGTGVAAGVAQAGLQAQQVARDRDRKKTQESDRARRVREAFETQLNTVKDVEKAEPTDPLHVEGHHSQSQQDFDEDLVQLSAGRHGPQADSDGVQADATADPPQSQSQQAPKASPASDTDDDSQLYHHLDVKG